MSSLKNALEFGDAPRIAFVGSGGKTTSLFRVASEFDGPVLVTSTSSMQVISDSRLSRRPNVTSMRKTVKKSDVPSEPRMRCTETFCGKPSEIRSCLNMSSMMSGFQRRKT